MYSPSRFLFDPSSISSRGNMFSGNDNQVFPGPKSIRNIEETTKRLLFFSSSSDIYDDEYYNEQFPEKKRRLTSEQVLMLEKSFDAENKLEPERKTQLAKKLGLQPRQVAVWFQNRRTRWRTKQLERDYNLLKTSYDSLASGYDFIFKENEKLKSEVALLHEKLQAKDEIAAPLSGLKSELLPRNGPFVSVLHLETRLTENLSSHSCGGAAVDEDNNPELENFQSNEHLGEDFQSPEEYEGSDDGQNYFNSEFVTMEQQQQKEDENLGWWAWS